MLLLILNLSIIALFTMKSKIKIAVFGSCPLPFEEFPVAGPALRTWQLTKPLINSGHEVLLIALRTDGVYPQDYPHLKTNEPLPGLTFCNSDFESFTSVDFWREKLKSFEPDAIVGAGSLLPVWTASQCCDFAPFWADIFGDPISEIQSKAAQYQNEEIKSALYHVWKLLTAILVRADHFSTLSQPQRHALIGELALCGRLNALTDGQDLVVSIPCGVDEDSQEVQGNMDDNQKKNLAQKLGVGDIYKTTNPFVVLWAGSYNTWIDVETLFSGLQKSMSENSSIHYLSLGGGTSGYNPLMYERFVDLVNDSPYKDRFHLVGWVPVNKVRDYYSIADVGLNVDRFTYEGVLGSRNRIVQFLRFGVPVITTALSEISHELAQENLVNVFPIGNPDGLCKLIVHFSENKNLLKEQAGKGCQFVKKQYGFNTTTLPLQQWICNPQYASDTSPGRTGGSRIDLLGEYLLPFQKLIDGLYSPQYIEQSNSSFSPLRRFLRFIRH